MFTMKLQMKFQKALRQPRRYYSLSHKKPINESGKNNRGTITNIYSYSVFHNNKLTDFVYSHITVFYGMLNLPKTCLKLVFGYGLCLAGYDL